MLNELQDLALRAMELQDPHSSSTSSGPGIGGRGVGSGTSQTSDVKPAGSSGSGPLGTESVRKVTWSTIISDVGPDSTNGIMRTRSHSSDGSVCNSHLRRTASWPTHEIYVRAYPADSRVYVMSRNAQPLSVRGELSHSSLSTPGGYVDGDAWHGNSCLYAFQISPDFLVRSYQITSAVIGFCS